MLQTNVICYLMTILLFVLDLTDAKNSRTYRIPNLFDCDASVKEIDGALITHRDSKNSIYDQSSCILKFESDDDFFTTKRIYLNLTDIHISDCSKKLSIYFKDNTNGRANYEFSCGSSNTDSANPGVVSSTSKYVSIHLNKQLRSPDRFSIVLTTVSDGFTCSEFRCSNGKCIDDDLECDGVNHCFDGSDERSFGQSTCSDVLVPLDVEKAAKVTLGVVIGIIIAIIVTCVLCCVCIICCCCKRGYKGNVIQRPPQNTTNTTVTQAGTGQPAVQAGAYPQPAYPPPQQAPYPTGAAPYPAAPAPYPPAAPAPYPPAAPAPAAGYGPPPPYQDKPYNDAPPYPPTAYAGVQYTANPDKPVVPSAPPSH